MSDHICPECIQGKHRNCNGDAWDFTDDRAVLCRCPDSYHDVVEAEIIDMRARVYLAGPMTGYPDYNFPAFDFAEKILDRLGYDVRNPAANGSGKSWDHYMRLDLAHVCEVDGVCLLDGWEASRGARLEVHVAHALGLVALPLPYWSVATVLRRSE